MQPCVTYNRINTLKWYREHAYDIAEVEGYDPTDREQAFRKCLEWGDKYPIGVLFRSERPALGDATAQLKDGPLNAAEPKVRDIRALIETFR